MEENEVPFEELTRKEQREVLKRLTDRQEELIEKSKEHIKNIEEALKREKRRIAHEEMKLKQYKRLIRHKLKDVI